MLDTHSKLLCHQVITTKIKQRDSGRKKSFSQFGDSGEDDKSSAKLYSRLTPGMSVTIPDCHRAAVLSMPRLYSIASQLGMVAERGFLACTDYAPVPAGLFELLSAQVRRLTKD
ncbi:hypothetical protein J6590_007830 [Homalodisca vitripennis]|nr:hypothetical protein J6590_007830 [Homalodisca vitripennis]